MGSKALPICSGFGFALCFPEKRISLYRWPFSMCSLWLYFQHMEYNSLLFGTDENL